MLSTRRTFLRHLGLGVAGFSVAGSLPASAWGAPFKTRQLPRSLPESQGVASTGILNFVNAVEAGKLNLHSLMVVRHGQVVAEGWWAPYAPDLKHTLYSLSKSFTSTAVGLAVAEGRLKVDDKVVSFFPEDLPATISPNLAAMRVRDLLSMSTGHDKDTTSSLRSGSNKNWIRAFLAQPVEHEPGTFFIYNSGATYMLSAIVQKLTGQTVLAYLKPRLFEPLGIEGADWETDPNGINTGGWGLRVRTEDIAKFGQLYLQKGVWKGKRILPEAWVEEATRSHIQSKGGSRKKEENDWLQGYGYQFWRCRNGAYRGDGAFGQYCIVMPKQDTVVAITSETGDMQAILDNLWNHLLPALQDTAGGKPQPELKQKLASLTLPVPVGRPGSPVAARINGKSFQMADNPLKIKTVSLAFKPNACVFTVRDEQGEHRVTCGLGQWQKAETSLSANPIKLVNTPVPGEAKTKTAGSGAWIDDKTFAMTWRFIETAHYDTVNCRFDDDAIRVEFRKSLAILNPDTKETRPVLEGRLMQGAVPETGK
ncbi:serine hydrolase domain-containing protein [Larkinella soli]|uniref:serine hydrolase domain-containing protein n=1 Tax=Larkinella soli TaxID=1770527 RepID=UPI000FFC764F|nr:serine hydrolase [Larkinella soli]